MTQSTDCDTTDEQFVVTDEMRARHAAWVDEYVAAVFDSWRSGGQVAGHSDLSSITRYAVASSDTMRRGAEAAGRIG